MKPGGESEEELLDRVAREQRATMNRERDDSVLNWVLALLFVIGVVLALWFGLFFDPAEEADKAAALNKRLTGVCGGLGLGVVFLLVKIYRVLNSRGG